MNGSTEMRADLQCYSRLVHLLSHYELGNYEILDSLSKSTHRFYKNMKKLTKVEQATFEFLQHSFSPAPSEIKMNIQKFYEKISHLENNSSETRSYAYLDIISWAESKLTSSTMEAVMLSKYRKSKRK